MVRIRSKYWGREWCKLARTLRHSAYMFVVRRVNENGQQHWELPAVVKSSVGGVSEYDGRYKNIPCAHYGYKQTQQGYWLKIGSKSRHIR